MFLIDPVVNVENFFIATKQALNSPSSLTKKSYLHIRINTRNLRRFVRYYRAKYHKSVSPDKIAVIDDILKELKLTEVKASKNDPDIARHIERIFSLYETYAAKGGSLYLFRHPKKSKDLRKEEGFSLDITGIPQIHNVGKMIAAEALFYPGNVEVHIFTSEMKRTKVFGKAIAHKLNLIAAHHKKDVKHIITEDNDLRFGNWDVARDYMKKNNITKDDCYKMWIRGNLKLSNTEQPDTSVIRISRFVRGNLPKIRQKNPYTIVIGLTHSFTLDAFIDRFITSNKEKNISSADFIKFECRKKYFEGKWY
jgi:broad specificity phosphatase PhoE